MKTTAQPTTHKVLGLEQPAVNEMIVTAKSRIVLLKLLLQRSENELEGLYKETQTKSHPVHVDRVIWNLMHSTNSVQPLWTSAQLGKVIRQVHQVSDITVLGILNKMKTQGLLVSPQRGTYSVAAQKPTVGTENSTKL